LFYDEVVFLFLISFLVSIIVIGHFNFYFVPKKNMCFKRGRKKRHIKKRGNKQEDERGRNPIEKKKGGGGELH
jgi:hypothetical protein